MKTKFQSRLRSGLSTLSKALQTEHHQAMEVRAKEKGVTLPAPRDNGCERMKARGFVK
ncbi:MAG: hypothetical protein U1A72_02475 [Sulfuritalea sp.]|nr:hypothetical protein [Sulfuritalea sp.]